MRSAVACFFIAVVGGVVGVGLTKSPEIIDKVTAHFNSAGEEAAGFWSTPAINGYGKIHYESDAQFQPTVGLSNKIVFQITRSEGGMKIPNLGLERVARVVNLYVAAGVPLEQLHFVVSVTGDATPAMLNNQQFHRLYGFDNLSLKLIQALNDAGVKVTVCDQSVAFHHFKHDWIDRSVVHALSSPTTVSTLENQGYALLQM